MTVLKIISDLYSFKEDIVKLNMPIYSCYDKGESRGNKKISEVNIISFDVSDKDWDDVSGQIDDAIGFLNAHKNKLKILLKKCNSTSAYLDIPFYCRIGDKCANQNELIPLKLISICSHIGIEIALAIYDKVYMEYLEKKCK